MKKGRIIGYKFKEEFKHLEKQALKIGNCLSSNMHWSVSKNIDFSVGSVFHSNFIKAGVLNIWFEPVYEIPTFEFGKWYKKPNSDYGKFLGLEGNKWLCKEYIGVRTQKYYNTGSYYSLEYMEDATLVTDLTEIQQYLPDGHPDKIVTSSKEEFVLPEIWWVRVTEENKDILSEWRFQNTHVKLRTGEICGMCKNFILMTTDKGHSLLGLTYEKNSFDFGNEITWEQFMQHVLKKRIIKNFTDLFTKDQLDLIDKLIDNKLKQLQ